MARKKTEYCNGNGEKYLANPLMFEIIYENPLIPSPLIVILSSDLSARQGKHFILLTMDPFKYFLVVLHNQF
jgi:hypothetical protein